MKQVAIPITGALRARMERVIAELERRNPAQRVTRIGLVDWALKLLLSDLERELKRSRGRAPARLRRAR